MGEFYRSVSPSNTWQSLVTIGQATSEIKRRKKKDLNYSGETMASPYYRKGSHNYSRMAGGQHSILSLTSRSSFESRKLQEIVKQHL